MPGGGRGEDSEPLAPSLFQAVSSTRAMAASLFCGQLVLTFPPVPIWHFLLAISLLPNFLHTRFPGKSLPSLLLGTCLILAGGDCHFTVLSLSNWSSHTQICSNLCTNGRTGAQSCTPARMSVLVGAVHYSVFRWEIWPQTIFLRHIGTFCGMLIYNVAMMTNR